MKIGVFHPKLNIPLVDELMELVIQGFEKFEPDAFIHREHTYRKCDVAIRWGMHSLKFPQTTMYRHKMDMQHEGPIGIIELGWLDRARFFQFGFGGISGNAKYYNYLGLDNNKRYLDDYRYHISSPRPQTSGDYILLCGQVPWDTSVQHIDYPKWLYKMAKNIKKHSDLPIVFRPHPKHPTAIDLSPLYNIGIRISDIHNRSLFEDLDGARCMVCFNSNAALDSIIHGTPAITFDKGSMVYDITHHNGSYVDDPLIVGKGTIQDKIIQITNCQWSATDFAFNTPWQVAKSDFNVFIR